ncbi:hypothetical protein SAMN05216548_12812 [Faunimonas pinastri]|uniref:Uncharacterized protein n=1 Tax=Faunimonas pinastri TaxID=1855383 RepID=A0A1H9QG81_9HYPH|nr:hypothetical protein [Faunimonas pinastri]SER59484.1 hypothetical protein SAMN05216548_12812 [Faunimonas pinastri]
MMKPLLLASSMASLLLPLATGTAVAGSVYTDLTEHSASCTPPDAEGFSWTCRGPGGHRIEFLDEGNIASFSVDGHEGLAFRGGQTPFGSKAEWVSGADGRPTALILRISSPGASLLTVTRLAPGPVCVVASAKDNGQARAFASVVGNLPCEHPDLLN